MVISLLALRERNSWSGWSSKKLTVGFLKTLMSPATDKNVFFFIILNNTETITYGIEVLGVSY